MPPKKRRKRGIQLFNSKGPRVYQDRKTGHWRALRYRRERQLNLQRTDFEESSSENEDFMNPTPAPYFNQASERDHDNISAGDDEMSILSFEFENDSLAESTPENPSEVTEEFVLNEDILGDTFLNTNSSGENESNEDIDMKQDTPSDAMNLAEKLLAIGIQCNVSNSAMDKIWKFILENCEDIAHWKHKRHLPGCFKTVRRHAVKNLNCPVHVDYKFIEKSTNKLYEVKDVDQIGLGKFPLDKFSRISETARIEVQDVIKFHKSIHPNLNGRTMKKVLVGHDGVQECKRTSVSMNVMALTFIACQIVYPLTIHRRLSPGLVDDLMKESRSLLVNLVRELNENKCKVEAFIADAPQRKKNMEMVSFNGYYGCDLCIVKADLFKSQNGTRQSTKRVWPPTSVDGELRTKKQTLQLASKRVDLIVDEDGEEMTYGVKGLSPLFELHDFDPFEKVMPESMHMAFLGIVPHLTILTIALGPAKSSISQRPRLKSELVSDSLLSIKVPSEFANRTRALSLKYKAEEWRNLVLFFFPVIVDLFPDEYLAERKLWSGLAFLLRAVSLPPQEYLKIDELFLEEILRKWYGLWFRTFGAENCSYNIHMFGAHLLQLRRLGPINTHSAFIFECMFAKLKTAYASGTRNIGKQCLENMLLKMKYQKHGCNPLLNLHGKSKITSKRNDSLIYVWDQNFIFYQIFKIEKDYLFCKLIVTCELECLGSYSWKDVGVFQYKYVRDREIRIAKSEVCGKAIRVGSVILTVPAASLSEN